MKIIEKDLSERLYNFLIKYFNVDTEVWSTNRKYRIDYVIEDTQTPGAYFGIEVKKIDHKRGNDLGEHILQAYNYSQSEFGNYGKIPIFVVPPLSYDYIICPDHDNMKVIEGFEYFKDRHDKNHDHHTINGFLGALNLGEMRTQMRTIYPDKMERQFVRIVFSNQEIWSNIPICGTKEHKGLNRHNYEKLIKKINGKV